MVNHFYTYLLNKKVEPAYSSLAHYTDPNFLPINLTDIYLKVYKLLFNSPNIETNLYYASCLLDLIHHVDLEPYTLKIDSRITYIPGDNNFKSKFDTKVSIEQFGIKGIKYYLNTDRLKESGMFGTYTWELVKDLYKFVVINGYNCKNVKVIVHRGELEKVTLLKDILELFVPFGYNFKVNVSLLNVGTFDLLALHKRIALFMGTLTPHERKVLLYNDTKYSDEIKELYNIYENSKDMVVKVGAFVLMYLYNIIGVYGETNSI